MTRETERTSIRWPTCATARAILCVISSWNLIEVQRKAGWRK